MGISYSVSIVAGVPAESVRDLFVKDGKATELANRLHQDEYERIEDGFLLWMNSAEGWDSTVGACGFHGLGNWYDSMPDDFAFGLRAPSMYAGGCEHEVDVPTLIDNAKDALAKLGVTAEVKTWVCLHVC